MAGLLEISILGGLTIKLDGAPVTKLASRKAEALLVYLACTQQEHAREVLADLLWDDRPQDRAMTNLRVLLTSLRRHLGPYVSITRQAVAFNSDSPHWLDAAELERGLTAVREGRTQSGVPSRERVTKLAQTLTLYQGDFLHGFYPRGCRGFQEWQVAECERLRLRTIEALHELVADYLDLGEYAVGIKQARRLLQLDPLREETYRQLMWLLVYSDQRNAALAQYDACRQVLAEKLGVEPTAETTALYERIRSGQLSKGANERGSPPAPRCNLPAQLTPLMGREVELTELTKLLADPDLRLVTITGPGGIGKTHLGLETARAQLECFTHGVYLVSLAPLESPDPMVATIAEALNFSFYEGGTPPQQQLLNYLRNKTMLLVLDNFEHLLTPVDEGLRGGAELVIDMLKAAPDLKILTTSRARLNVRGEQLFPISGIDFPPEEISVEEAAGFSAVKLFLHSARRMRPDFELTAGNVRDVSRICHLVQGMPLGILLAAAWVELLTPAEIVAEIGRGLDFLATDWRDVPERQQSLRAVFNHSWRLLTAREQVVLAQLSVFRGGFTRQAAQAVTGASLRELVALVDKSLLYRAPTERYEMHELLRQYASDQLGQMPAAGEAAFDRHSAYFASFLQEREADLKGARRQAALAEIEADSENVRAAWNRAVAHGQIARIDQALESLISFYGFRHRYPESEAALRSAAEKLAATESADGQRVLAKVLMRQGALSWFLGELAPASQLLSKSLSLLDGPALADQDTPSEKAHVLLLMGRVAADSGNREEAEGLFRQSLTLYQTLGEEWRRAFTLDDLSMLAQQSGRFDEAQQLAEESLAIRRTLDDPLGIAISLDLLGWLAVSQGRLEAGEQLIRESIHISREIGHRVTAAVGLSNLADVFHETGRFAEAVTLLQEALAIFNDLGLPAHIAPRRVGLGWVAMHLGQYEEARLNGQTGLDPAQEAGDQLAIIALELLGLVALAEERYADAQQLYQENLAASMQRRNTVALAGLGCAARGLGNRTQAQQYLAGALRKAAEDLNQDSLKITLAMVALLLADQGEQERAVELYALLARYPFVANSRWFEDVIGQHIAAVAATLPPDVVAAAQGRGQARDLEATVKELLAEFEDS